MSEVPLQPWAKELYEARIANNGKDHPSGQCLPSGIPEKNNIPDGLELVQTPDLILFLYESRTIYRQVFLDGRPLLGKDAQPTWMGYSVGKWDGDTHERTFPATRTIASLALSRFASRGQALWLCRSRCTDKARR